jgi:WD40 repeat protein/tetratricopeptide (TPR) repeat protein
VFSPDGRRLVTAAVSDGGRGDSVRVWDVATGRPAGRPIEAPADNPVRHVAFSPDGRRLLLANAIRTARLYDPTTGEPAGPTLAHERGYMSRPAFSADGRLVATTTDDGHGGGEARVWEAATGKPVGPPLTSGEQNMASFSLDGRMLAVAVGRRPARPGQAFLWEVDTGQRVTSLNHPGPVHSAEFAPDGLRVLTACGDGVARLWDLLAGEGPLPVRLGGAVRQASFGRNGRQVLTDGADGTVRVWDVADSPPDPWPWLLVEWKDAVAYCPDGRRLAAGGEGGRIDLLDAATGDPVRPPLRQPGTVKHLAFDPEGVRMAAAGRDTVRVWDLATGAAVAPFKPEGGVGQMRFAGDGRLVTLDQDGGRVRLWDAGTGRPVLSLAGAREVNDVVVSPAGRSLATAAGRGRGAGEAVLWDAATGRRLRALSPNGPVSTAAFSPDGRLLLTAVGDPRGELPAGEARLWDAGTGRLLHTLRHDGPVLSVAFHPDGHRVVTGSADRTARVWAVADGQRVAPPLKHRSLLEHVAFSADGRRIITVARDDTARVWDAATGEPLTPPLHDAFRVITFDPTRGFMTGRKVNWGAHFWRLPADDRPVARWERLAQVLAGRRVDETEELTALEPGRLRTAWREVRSAYPSDFERTPEQVRDWHRRQAQVYASASQWASAVWHLDRLLEQGPGQRLDRVARGIAHARLGQAEKAVADYTKALELRPDAGLVWLGRGLVHAQQGRLGKADEDLTRALEGDVVEVGVWPMHAVLRLRYGGIDGYRAACARLAARLTHLDDERVFNVAAWALVLGPGAVRDYAPVVRCAEAAVAWDPRQYGPPNTLGAVLYRAGSFKGAVKQLSLAIEQHGKGGTALDWLFLAMAHHRLGHAAEAKKWLGKAEQAVKTAEGQSWQDRLELRLLHREAEELLRKPAAGE